MFNTSTIKAAAKERMKQNHWMVVLVTFIASLLGGVAGAGGAGGFNFNYNTGTEGDATTMWGEMPEEAWAAILVILLVAAGVALIVAVLSIAYSIFVASVVRVGFASWLLRFYRGENPGVGELFAPFKRQYMQSVRVMFATDLRIFLWSLLFIIPGIIKSYAYLMVPHLLHDNPNLTPKQAMDISNRMTMGYKGDLFWLGLSFIGWRFLAMFTCGILDLLYVTPWFELSFAAAYEDLKWIAIQSGTVAPEEFGPVVVETPAEPVVDTPAAE
jgi:uncharacterized membrane protein